MGNIDAEEIRDTNPQAFAMFVSFARCYGPYTAVLVRCADERTGARFGRAKKRAGLCVKVGSGGRNGNNWAGAYQLWASVAPCDTKGETK